MPLTSSSTDAEVQAEYDNTASYILDQDLDKARRFVVAATIMISRRPSSMTKGANAMSNRVDLIDAALQRAQKWLEARSTDDIPPDVFRPSFVR